MAVLKNKPQKDGNVYIPFEKRTGDFSTVYFTRDLSPEGLEKGAVAKPKKLKGAQQP